MSFICKIKNNMEHRTWLRRTELIFFALLLVATITLFTVGIARVNRNAGDYDRAGETETMMRLSPDDPDYAEDYDEAENRICTVTYRGASGRICRVDYSFSEWEVLPENDTVTAHIYTFESGAVATFDHPAHEPEIRAAVKDYFAEEAAPLYNTAIVLALLTLSLGVVTFFARQFSTYEKIWFLSIMVLAAVFAIAMPEEEANGVSGIWIMLLYLLDTFLNILCELLISKQSRWNFIVSVAVEIAEITICIVLMYRFATMLTTLFFWLPIDILSFINWSKHPDREKEEVTRVRTLKGWQEVLILAGIAVWTILVGYFLSGLNIRTDLFGGDAVKANIVCYLDACASAVGVANGLFIFFRFREQWIAWYACAVLEAVINIISGQFILLVLKLGYITNTTYGYIRWTRYIRGHAASPESVEAPKEKREFF